MSDMERQMQTNIVMRAQVTKKRAAQNAEVKKKQKKPKDATGETKSPSLTGWPYAVAAAAAVITGRVDPRALKRSKAKSMHPAKAKTSAANVWRKCQARRRRPNATA